MKTKISIAAIILMAFIAISATPVEPSTVKESIHKTTNGFSFIRTHRQGKGASISWSFISGNAVGFTVQRTYEDPTDLFSWWDTVSNVPYNASRSYKVNDDNLTSGFISYRVIALMDDGTTMTSDVSTVRLGGR